MRGYIIASLALAPLALHKSRHGVNVRWSQWKPVSLAIIRQDAFRTLLVSIHARIAIAKLYVVAPLDAIKMQASADGTTITTSTPDSTSSAVAAVLAVTTAIVFINADSCKGYITVENNAGRSQQSGSVAQRQRPSTYSSLTISSSATASSASSCKAPSGASNLFDSIATTTATIKNSGNLTGAEVAQLYIWVPSLAPVTAPKQPSGFSKLRLSTSVSSTTTF
ncbi:hypothetical protein K432DRAFT_408790 [Lepidopterella palustris CBS 459.81]|uniref:beta-glucosidase n=1 Tax=Lepidopterella palustris CBS 459.81 TaxID=1314670 RepID=A0A8E2E1L8_9PEZI|nr:hypothetical protein K432DRAFT_408790 [Lepidopterella palustris CBS 459.81]